MTNKEMAVELARVNNTLQSLTIPAAYNNLVKLASSMESIDSIIVELNEKPEPPVPEEDEKKNRPAQD